MLSPPQRPTPPPTHVTIERIGAEGDGIARLPDGTPLYLPFTLPDEQVTARPLRPRGDGWHAAAEAIDTPSPARAQPPCRHFGHCGGCVLQALAGRSLPRLEIRPARRRAAHRRLQPAGPA